MTHEPPDAGTRTAITIRLPAAVTPAFDRAVIGVGGDLGAEDRRRIAVEALLAHALRRPRPGNSGAIARLRTRTSP